MECTIPAPKRLPIIVRPEPFIRATTISDALCPNLERQLLALCARPAPYRIEALVLDQGPGSFEELVERSGKADCSIPDGQRIPVGARHSERTIWSRPAVNSLFRAWHDSIHLASCRGFGLEDEIAVWRTMDRWIEGEECRAYLFAESVGQIRYYEAHGYFPEDQRAFVLACIRDGADAAVVSGEYHTPDSRDILPTRPARVDVLCGCGWGRMGVLEEDIPAFCPVCERATGAA